MTIIHVEDYFDPDSGYQINELLRQPTKFTNVYLICSKVMTPFHKKFDEKKDSDFEKKFNVKIIRIDHYFTFSTRVLYKGLFRTIDQLKPDLLYLHGIADFHDLILFRRKKPYIIVRDSHQSWVASLNKFRKLFYFFYRIIFTPIINKGNKYSRIYALGVEEKEYIINLGIKEEKVKFLPHGFSDTIMKYSESERNSLRKSLNIPIDAVFIGYIGKFDFIKKPHLVLDIIDLLNKELIQNNKIYLLFLGSQDKFYMEFFLGKLNRFNKVPQENIFLYESKSYDELYKYFSSLDITIFPKACTLSSIHAQICGATVVMERYSSNIERVINKSNLFSPNDLKEASLILSRMIETGVIFDRKNDDNSVFFSNREYKSQIKELESLVEW